MTKKKTWPATDQQWLARYRASMVGKHVPTVALEERELELLNAVCEADLPAAELFGDAHRLAAEDVTELATAGEAVRTSEGGGLRPALKEAGGTLLGIGIVSVLLIALRNGWSADINVAHLLVAVSVVVVFVGWVAGRACFSAGRAVAMIGALMTAGTLAVMGIASAAALGNGHLAASEVPVPFLCLALLTPGVITLVLASRMPQQVLRTSWDDTDWLRRFRGGLRARLVPASTARGHVAEIKQSLRARGESSYEEFGHPLVLAREIADADRTARSRRWWLSTLVGTGSPLVIAAFVIATQSWGALTTPVVVILLLGSFVTLAAGWRRRPWSQEQ
jgi:hypothetical protein